MTVFEDHVAIRSGEGVVEVALDTLRDVQIDGSSMTTGGGFIGGGFGAKAAVEGMVVSTVLNSLTTKTKKWVTIGIVTEDGWMSARLDNHEATPVRSALRILADQVIVNRKIREGSVAHSAEEPDAQEDLVSRLERLGAMHASGSLTEEEFAAAKARLLGTGD